MTFQEGSSVLILFNLLLLIVLFFLVRKKIEHPFDGDKRNRSLTIGLLLVFCLFSFWGGDWFHYQYGFDHVFEITHMEPVYIWLLEHSYSYLFFRIIVWGVALVLLLKSIKSAQVDYDIALSFFSMGSLIWFSYARVSLSFALMFFGLALISKQRSSLFVKVFGILFLWFSVYFHKSAPFGIVIILFSLIISVVRSRYVPFLLLLFVLIISMGVSFNIGGFLDNLSSADNETLSEYASAGSFYVTDGKRFSFGINYAAGWLRLIEVLVFLLETVLSLMLISRTKLKEIPYNIRCFAMSVLLIFLTATFIGVSGKDFLGTIQIRLLRFCIIPSVIVFTYSIQMGYFRKYCSFVFYFCCFSTFAHVLYSLYCTI